jgi:hypothetical protein
MMGSSSGGKRYLTTSRAYLTRAMECLRSARNEDLFYAAFELRCGVEARLQEYLEASQLTKKRIKQGWSIPQLTKAGANAFLHLPNIQRIEVTNDRERQFVFYYTPVSESLRKEAAHLGNYMHALQKNPNAEGWFAKFKRELETVAADLLVATTGTLLGPVLMKPGSPQVQMLTEIIDGRDPQEFAQQVGTPGSSTLLNVSYIDELPARLEPDAVVWKVRLPE